MDSPAVDGPKRRMRLGEAMVSPDSYGLVLLLIVATYTVSMSFTSTWAASVVIAVQIATVWVVLRVSNARRLVRRVADVLLFLAAVAAVVNLFTGKDSDEALITLVSAMLYLIAPFSILRHLVGRAGVDRQTLLGAIDAYLLFGMFFAFVYRFFGVIGSAPFFGSSGDGTFPQDLFFSFTTLTTTGYGNLVPAENPGQTL
ncbi:MAG TPA: ion channel, partial [Actinomycetota bacterium]|nr:ion channel [Actinomycetota bacterium]